MDFNQYIGIPFKSKGRTREGLDCWGLIRLLYLEQFQIELPSYVDDYLSASDFKTAGKLIEDNLHRWIKIDPSIRTLGDVIVLRIYGQPIHMGMLINDQQMIHVFKNIDTCVQRIYTSIWKQRIHGIYRHSNLVNS